MQAGLLSREIVIWGAHVVQETEGHIVGGARREPPTDPARSGNHGMYGIFMRENREIPRLARRVDGRAGRLGNAEAVSLR